MIDIREHAGPFGGGAPKEIVLADRKYFPPTDYLEMTLTNAGTTGNNDMMFKYIDPITYDVYYGTYDGNGNYRYYVHKNGDPAPSQRISLLKYNPSQAQLFKLIRRNSKLYLFMGANVEVYTEAGVLLYTKTGGALINIDGSYWKDANTFIFPSDRYVYKFNFSTETFTQLIDFGSSMSSGSIFGRNKDTGVWYAVDNFASVIVKNESNALISKSADYLMNGVRGFTSPYRATNLLLSRGLVIVVEGNNPTTLKKHRLSDFAFLSTTSLGYSGFSTNCVTMFDGDEDNLYMNPGNNGDTYKFALSANGDVVNKAGVVLSTTSNPTFESAKTEALMPFAFRCGQGNQAWHEPKISAYLSLESTASIYKLSVTKITKL